MSIGVAMLLIAGAALGFWLVLDVLQVAGTIRTVTRLLRTGSLLGLLLSCSYWVDCRWLGLRYCC